MAKYSNQEIERRAIAYIKKKYKNAREPENKSGCGYDLIIGHKIVEVKGTESSSWRQNIYLSRRNEYLALKNNKKRYWIFRVFNVGKPTIDIKLIPAKDLNIPIPDERWRVTIKKGK